MSVARLARGAAFLASLAGPTLAFAQQRPLPATLDPRPTTAAITEADLMTRLYRFADDSMGGRATGTEYHLKATAYIASEAARVGLQPAGDNGSFFQDLPMVHRGFAEGGSVRLGERRFRLGEDFAPMVARGGTPRLAANAEVVDGGVHGDTSTWISAVAARGKLVVLRPNPRQLALNARFLAVSAGSRFAEAAAVVIPAWEQLAPPARASLSRPSLSMRSATPLTELPPTLIASGEMAAALLAAAGSRVTSDLRFIETPAPARNVVAILPGSDPRLRGQYVALGAHTDHDPLLARPLDHDSLRAAAAMRATLQASLPAGTRPTPQQLASLRVNVDSLRAIRPARPDSIKNGADDDGSGTVVLLELAEAFAGAAERPKRSILFVWHAAEEIGLLGAAHYTNEPTVPLDSIVAQLNMDMVGRGGTGDIAGGGPDYLQLVGSRRLSRELGDLVEAINKRQPRPFAFDYSFDADGHPERIYCRSDHAMYARHGIPVTFFHTGLHRDYHQVTDEPQYIEYEKMTRIAQFIYDVARELGDRADRPKRDGPKPDPNATCRQ
jgi:hypothetical protein